MLHDQLRMDLKHKDNHVCKEDARATADSKVDVAYEESLRGLEAVARELARADRRDLTLILGP